VEAAVVVIHGQVVADTVAAWFGLIISQYPQVVRIVFKLDAVVAGVDQQAVVHVGQE
jgi:hypothetical protein